MYILVVFCLLVPVAVRSKAQVCGRSSTEIVGSNPAGGMVVCCECCGLGRTDYSSRDVLPTVARRCYVMQKRQECGGHGPRWAAAPQEIRKVSCFKHETRNYPFGLNTELLNMNSYRRPYERYVVLDSIETTGPGPFQKKPSEIPIVVPCSFRMSLNSRLPEWN